MEIALSWRMFECTGMLNVLSMAPLSDQNWTEHPKEIMQLCTLQLKREADTFWMSTTARFSLFLTVLWQVQRGTVMDNLGPWLTDWRMWNGFRGITKLGGRTDSMAFQPFEPMLWTTIDSWLLIDSNNHVFFWNQKHSHLVNNKQQSRAPLSVSYLSSDVILLQEIP